MNKKLIALAVAAAMAPMAANAEVEVYGQANVSIDVADNGAVVATPEASQNGINVSSNSSRIGFKASEDLGNGMTAVAVAEFSVAMDQDGGGISGDRNTYVGVAGDFGTIAVGRLDTPYKSSTKGMGIFGDTTADYRNIVGANGAADTRADNAIAFMKDVNDDVSFAVAYVPDSNDNDIDEGAVTFSVNYDTDMLDVAVGYVAQDGFAANTDATGLRVGVSYAVNDDVTVSFVHDTVTLTDVPSGIDADIPSMYLAATMASGDNTFGAAFGTVEVDGAADTDGTYMALGVEHTYSETVGVYAIYSSMDNAVGATWGLGGSQGLQLAGVADEAATSLSVGIRTKF